MAIRRLTRHFYTLYNDVKYTESFDGPTFPDSGGSATFVIVSTSPWEMISKPDWITMSATDGGAGNTTVTLTVADNPTNTGKTGSIQFTTKNGWGKTIVANCAQNGKSAWITVCGSTESPQTQSITWDTTGVTFPVGSLGGWSSEKLGSWTGGINPTGNTDSNPNQNVRITATTNTSSAATKSLGYRIKSRVDSNLAIDVNITQEAKPNILFGNVGEDIGNGVYAIPYNGEIGVVNISANTTFNVTGTTPATDYITMESPITGTGIYSKDVNYTALTLNSGQTEASGYNYTISAFSSDNSVSGSVKFNYEPYPYIPEVSMVSVTSGVSDGSVSAVSNYWLDVTEVKECTLEAIEKPSSYTTGGSITIDSKFPATNGLNPYTQSDAATSVHFSAGSSDAYIFYSFDTSALPNKDCSFVICYFHAAALMYPDNGVGTLQLYCGDTPVGQALTLPSTTSTGILYNINTGPLTRTQLTSLRLKINAHKNIDIGSYALTFLGASVFVGYEEEGSTDKLSASAVHYQGVTPLSASVINYHFTNTPGPITGEAFKIKAQTYSARTVGTLAYQMLGPSVSGDLLNIMRLGTGNFAHLIVSAASTSITYDGLTEIAAYFDDGQGGVPINVTTACTWAIVSGASYGSIYSSNNKWYFSGNNQDSTWHSVRVRATYNNGQYINSIGIIVNAYDPTPVFSVTISPDTIEHNGTATVSAYYEGIVPAAAIIWSFTGDGFTSAITGDNLIINGNNNTSGYKRLYIRGEYNGMDDECDLWIKGTGTTTYSVEFIATGTPATSITYDADIHNSNTTAGTITRWVQSGFYEGDNIYWTASTTGYEDETGTYEVTAGTNEINIVFSTPIPPCLEISPETATTTYTGNTSFTATYYQYCGESAGQNVTNSASWYVSPSGYGTISNGIFTANNQTYDDVDVDVYAVYNGVTSDTSTVTVGAKPAPPTPKYTVTFKSYNNIVYNFVSYTAGTMQDTKYNFISDWEISNIPENTTFNWYANKTWYDSDSGSFTVTGDTTIDLYNPDNFEVAITANTVGWTGSSTGLEITMTIGTFTPSVSVIVPNGSNTQTGSTDFGVVTSSTASCSIEFSGVPSPSNCTITITDSDAQTYTTSPSGTVNLTAYKVRNGCEFTFTWS